MCSMSRHSHPSCCTFRPGSVMLSPPGSSLYLSLLRRKGKPCFLLSFCPLQPRPSMSPFGRVPEDAMAAPAEHHDPPSPAPALPEIEHQQERPAGQDMADFFEANAVEPENELDENEDDTDEDSTLAGEDDAGNQGCPIRVDNMKLQNVEMDMAAVQKEAHGTAKGNGKEPSHDTDQGGENAAHEDTESPAMQASRGKRHIRRIEDTARRQVTFCKRRNGLLKKAHELSVLCDADILLIVFSSTGKLFEFASSSVQKILDRYRKYIGFTRNGVTMAQRLEYWKHEASRLRIEATLVDQMNRNMLGENLGCFQIRELQSLEGQLENSLSLIKSRMAQMLVGDIHGYHVREHLLSQENELLKCKLAKLSMQSPTSWC